jgi:hypothetical protein
MVRKKLQANIRPIMTKKVPEKLTKLEELQPHLGIHADMKGYKQSAFLVSS